MNTCASGAISRTALKLLFSGVIILGLLGGQSAFSVTDSMYFTVNGDSTLTTMTQGDEISWTANCDPGASIKWEIWYDLNQNSIIDTTSDLFLATMGLADGSPQGDVDGLLNGWISGPTMLLGVAPGDYIFKALDMVNGSSVQGVLTSNAMVAPQNKITGKIIVPGHPAPDAAVLKNVWISTESDYDEAGIYIGLTDENGAYELNIGAVGSGLDFYVEAGTINQFVAPDWQASTVTVNGVVSNVDITFEVTADSVYGFIKDENGDPIKTVGTIRSERQWPELGEKQFTSIDSRYVINYSAADLGVWALSPSSEGYQPAYLLPENFYFSHDTIGTFQKDFTLYSADTVIYVRVTEEGGTPVNNYLISAWSSSLNTSGRAISRSGSDNITPVRISSLDNSDWYVEIRADDNDFPMPAGFIVEGSGASNVSPGDTVTLNLVGGIEVSGMVFVDADDPTLIWDNVSVFLGNAENTYSGRVSEGGSYSLFASPGTYGISVWAENYLPTPGFGNVIVTDSPVAGPSFTLNNTHSKIKGTLLGLPLPLGPEDIWVTASTDTSPNGYQADGALVDKQTGEYTLKVCDGNWTIWAPNIEGYYEFGPVTSEVWEYPDTLRIQDYEYAPLSCCSNISGNVDCDPTDFIDINDLTVLIDYLFISYSPLCCEEEANIDAEGIVDINDLTRLIDYLFISFTPPNPCQ